MKRFSKFLALALSVCLLAGAIAIFASAEEVLEPLGNLGYGFDEKVNWNDNKSTYYNSGSGSASSYSKFSVAEEENGNKYLRFVWTKDSTSDKSYRRDIEYGGFISGKAGNYMLEDGDSNKIIGLSGYSYLTVDFSIAADQWRYLIDEEEMVDVDTGEVDDFGIPIYETQTQTVTKEYLTTEDPRNINGAYGIRLAYSNNSQLSIDNRGVYEKSEGVYDYAANYNAINVILKYHDSDSKWHVWIRYFGTDSTVGAVATDTGITLSNNLGEWNNFRYVIKSDRVNVGTADAPVYSYGFSMVKLYINDTYVAESEIMPTSYNANLGNCNTAKALDMSLKCVNWQINNYAEYKTNGTAKNPHDVKFSMAMDNFAPTYYPIGWTSGDAEGVDDLFTEYIQINDGDCIYTPYYFQREIDKIATLQSGSVIRTSLDLENITPMKGAELTILCDSDVNVTLSSTAIANSSLIFKTDEGYVITSNITRPTTGSGENLVEGTYAYNEYDNDAKGTWGSGQQGGDYVSNNIVTAENGNKYLVLKRDTSATKSIFDNNGKSGYREYDLSKGGNGSYAATQKNSLHNKYDYVTVDFDFGTDRYVAQIGWRLDGNSTTKSVKPDYMTFMSKDVSDAEIQTAIDASYAKLKAYAEDEAYKEIIGDLSKYERSVDDVRNSFDLAYIDAKTSSSKFGSNSYAFYMIVRGWNGSSESQNLFFYVYKQGDSWYLSLNNSTLEEEDYKLPDNPGEFVHISIVVKTDHVTSANTMFYAYANGKYLGEKKYAKSTKAEYPDFYLDSIRFDIPPYAKTNDCFAYALDNMSVNYYAKGYTSGEAYGIDDFMASETYKTEPLYNCTDIIYGKQYVSANGYVRVDGSLPVSDPVLVDAAMATAHNGSVIEASIDFINYVPAEGVTNFTVKKAGIMTFSVDEQVSREQFLVAVDMGDYYEFREATDEEKVTVKWVYNTSSGDKVLKTETLVFGVIPDAAQFAVDSFEFDSTVTKLIRSTGNYKNWKLMLDGETVAIRALTKDEVMAIDGELVIFTSEVDVATYEMNEYVIGVYDGEGNFIPNLDKNGGYESYNDISTLKAEFEAAPSGSTVIFLYDEPYDIGAESTLSISAGKTMSVDLNGRTLVHSYGSKDNYGNGLFYVYNGATFNLTTTAPGAQLVEAKVSKIDSTTVYGAAGIIVVPASVDGCVINVSGDITFIAGTVYKISGGKYSTVSYADASDADAERNNDVNIVINVNGGTYYDSIRPSYGVFCNLAPDLVINVVGAKFYTTNTTYAVFHDYQNTSSTSNGVTTYQYYNNDMTLYAKDCEFISKSRDDKSFAKVFYALGSRSEATLEGCTIIGKMANKKEDLDGKLILGADNVIATNTLDYFALSNVYAKEGVQYAANYSGVSNVITRTYTHSKLTNAAGFFLKNEAGKLYLDPDCYDVTKFIDSTASGNISLVTFKADAVPSYVAEINWVDLADNALGTTYAFVGDTVAELKAVGEIEGAETVASDWYTKSFAWANTESGKYEALAGVNTFKPTASYETKILGMKQNATLFTDMTYNLYLPVSADVSGVSVDGADLAEETVVISGVTYYVVSVTPEIEDFAAAEATIKFVAADGAALEYDVILDVVSYADAVAKYYDHASKESTLVYEMMNYKECAAMLLNPSFEAPENLVAFKSSHAECECGVGEVVISEEEQAVDYSALIAKGVTGVSYIVNLDEMGMVISVGEGVEVTSVTYTDALGRVITHTVEEGNLVAKNGYYLVIGVSAAYIDNIMTITVDGATGTYCLGKYIVNQPGVAIAEAIYKYAVAAENFKNIVKE